METSATSLFHQIQAQLERQLVESTIRRREQQRLDQIPDYDAPLFEFELARAAERREQRRLDQVALLNAASGKGNVCLAIPSPKPLRRFSVRSWKALASETSNVQPSAEEDGGPRANAVVRRWADLFWLTCNRDRLHGVLQRDYCEMYIAVLKTLYESFDPDKAGLIARRHFAQIVASGERGLTRDAMRRAMLDTADAWVTSPTPESYIDFFKKLFFRIASPRTGNEFRWRDLDAIPPSMDETRRPFNVDSLPDYTKLVGVVSQPPLSSSLTSSLSAAVSAPAGRRLVAAPATRRTAPEPASVVAPVEITAPEPASTAILPAIRGATTAPTTTAMGRRNPGPRVRAVARVAKRPSVDDIDLERLRYRMQDGADDRIAIQDLILRPAATVRDGGGRVRRRVSRDTSWLEVRSTPLRHGAQLPSLAAAL